MPAYNQNFSIPQGDDLTVDFNIDPAPLEFDTLTGAQIIWAAAPYVGFVPGVVMLTKSGPSSDIIVTNPTAMTFSLKLNRADTLTRDPDIYFHQVTIISAAGKYATVTLGTMTIEDKI